MVDFFYASLQATPVVAVVIAFVTGILFSLSPCTFAMAPVVMGYVGGYSGNSKSSRLKGLVYSLSFVLGNAFILAILGATVSYIGGGITGQGVSVELFFYWHTNSNEHSLIRNIPI